MNSKTLTPVTINMIKRGTIDDGSLLHKGRTITNVKIIGATREVIEASSRSKILLVEDGTGAIKVKVYIGDTVMNTESNNSGMNCWVRIIGRLRDNDVAVIDGQPTFDVIASRIDKLVDGNQITHHYLEVVYSHLKFQAKQIKVLHEEDSKLSGIEVAVIDCIKNQGEYFVIQ